MNQRLLNWQLIHIRSPFFILHGWRGIVLFSVLGILILGNGHALSAPSSPPGVVGDFPNRSGIAALDGAGQIQALFPIDGFPTDVEILPSQTQFAVVTQLGEFLVFSGDGERLFSASFEPLQDVDYAGIDSPRYLLTSRTGRRVFFFDPASSEQQTVSFSFEGPVDADLLPNGNLLVCDAAKGSVLEITLQGEIVWQYENGLQQPMDAIRLPGGETMIADFDNHRVLTVSPQGGILSEYRGYDHPIKLTLLDTGFILVADADQQEIEEINPEGRQRTIRGRLNYIQSVVFSPALALYLCAVQTKFPPPAELAAISTPAGVPSSRINPLRHLFTSRYFWLVVAIMTAFVSRRKDPFPVLARWAYFLPLFIILGIVYRAQTEAAASPRHWPDTIFWLGTLGLCLIAFRDSAASYWPRDRWQDREVLWRFPFTLRESIGLLLLPVLALAAQYFYLKPLPLIGRLPWYVPMAVWSLILYRLFRSLVHKKKTEPGEHSLFQLGPVTVAVPFTTGSVSLDGGEDSLWDEGKADYDPPLVESWANTILIGVLILGAALYFIGSTSIPTDVHGDEAEVALYGVQVRDTGNWNFFVLGWYKIPHLFFLIPAWVMWFCGDNLFGVRVAGALTGLAAIPLCYLTARRFLRPAPAAMAAFLFATSSIVVHFSRIGIGYNQTVVFVLLVLYGLSRGIQNQDTRWLVFSGLCCAIGILSYQAAKILLPLSVASLLLLWLTRAIPSRGFVKGLASLFLGFWIGIAPLLGTYLVDNQAAFSRAKSVTFFSPEGEELMRRSYPANISLTQMMLHQLERSLLAPISFHDNSPYLMNPSSGGMLDPMPAILFMAGFFLLAGMIRHPAARILILWLIVYLLIGSAMTDHAPSYQRILGLTPILAIVAASALNGLLVQAARQFRWLPRTRLHLATTVMAVLLILGFHRYFHQIMSKPQMLDEWTRIARYLEKEGPVPYTYFFGPPHVYFQYGTLRFLAQNVRGEDVMEPEGFLRQNVVRRGSVCFLLVRDNQRYLNELRRLYPGGREENHYNREGNHPFTTYVVNF